MCYSTESSMIAWIISVVIGVYLWYRNKMYDRWNAGFIWSFSMIQLWEAGIWNTTDKHYQELFVKLIALTLASQPLMQTFGAWTSTDKKSRLLHILIGVYVFLFVYTLYEMLNKNFWVTKGPNGHLVWNSSNGDLIRGVPGILYLIGLFIGLLYGIPNTVPLIAIGILTLVWSINRASTKEVASYWCYSAVAYSIVALFS